MYRANDPTTMISCAGFGIVRRVAREGPRGGNAATRRAGQKPPPKTAAENRLGIAAGLAHKGHRRARIAIAPGLPG